MFKPAVLAAEVVLPLRFEGRVFVTTLGFAGGQKVQAIVDTGSGSITVPSERCDTPGCKGHRHFKPDWDDDGHFLAGDGQSDIHLTYAAGTLVGTGFEGRVCLGAACGTAKFIVAVFESEEFSRYKFDAVLGLGLPRQAYRSGFCVIDALREQGVLRSTSFAISWPRGGSPSLHLGIATGDIDGNSSVATAFNATNVGDASENKGTAWLPVDVRHGEWAITMQDVGFGSSWLSACGEAGCRAVVDSGCAGIALPQSVAARLAKEIDLGDCSQLGYLPSLWIRIGGQNYEISPEDYVEVSRVDASKCRLAVSEMPDSTTTRTAILGVPFFAGRRLVFERAAMRIGIALTA